MWNEACSTLGLTTCYDHKRGEPSGQAVSVRIPKGRIMTELPKGTEGKGFFLYKISLNFPRRRRTMDAKIFMRLRR